MKKANYWLVVPVVIAFAPHEASAHGARRGGGDEGAGGYRPAAASRPRHVARARPTYAQTVRAMYAPRFSQVWHALNAPPAAIRVTGPPLRPYDEQRSPAPSPSFLWIPGYWDWIGEGQLWNSGHWELPPTPGALWIAPQWSRGEGEYYSYVPGYWHDPNGGYYSAAHTEAGSSTRVDSNVGPTGASALSAPTQGALAAGDDSVGDGRVANVHSVELGSDQTATTIVAGGQLQRDLSRTLDSAVQVFFTGNVIALDDNGAGGADSQVTFTPSEVGSYAIRATPASGGLVVGGYTLSTYEGDAQIDSR